ncbi:acetoacetate--CoA ligase [Iodobacter sp. CM08]|uniref:acetoacetate--CoA ligase n=1 Tax=Iodobacter sp. CM08 TaxID=3085902 RepID=UPI002981AB5D|nr:acetoacetate--CoA ligase [Iodobacter sp. CM08]MDW5414991.1 acetoacetate--CoA ligase [Iodobacter sp. CM08]
MQEALWTPSPEQVAATQMDAFRHHINQAHHLDLTDYAQLHAWSVAHRVAFWQGVVDFFAVHFSQTASEVLSEDSVMPSASWYKETELNFAEHLLRRRDDHPALIAIAEDGSREALSFAELAAHVAGLQKSLAEAGIGFGDRIAAFMPNTWQTIVGALAAASLGATWSSCSPDFGTQGVSDRFGQIEPKVLIACAAYRYAGKTIGLADKIKEIIARLPSIEQLIIVPYANPDAEAKDFKAGHAKITLWDDFYQAGGEPIFTPVPFAHPLYIMYSSGTTGVPKCIVHGTGGTLLQHLKELGLHTDLTDKDTLCYYTTCGWMMWNWMMSGLALGASIVLFDGSPFHPNADRLINLIDQENISIFGTSAKYLAALEKAGSKPKQTHRLEHLKALLSTGSPLSHESFEYVYRDVKQNLCLSSISGGTDIISCFALGNPVLPVWIGELQCKGLGMAVEVWNDAGQPVIGEKGELVCTRHFTAMPVSFWNDPDGEKLKAAYFSQYLGVWAQGDYAEETIHGGIIIHGRSDAVLNPGGVRIGTAEIYRQVEKLPEILESIAIGQDWDNDVRVVLFVRLREGVELSDALQNSIRQIIRSNTTPRHVPAKIVQVNDIPRTISGKIVELAVRNVVHGRPVKNTDALANPQALEEFRNRTELAS